MILDLLFPKKQKSLDAPKVLTKDRHVKSIIKAISWRVIGSIDTIMISWILTGKITTAVSIGGVEVFSKIFLYYLHERIWNIIRWGRISVRFRRNVRFFRKSIRLKNVKTKIASLY
ncbi:MAG: DUF2061 domain-containing protein [Bacteroidales bacterium]